jgi:hypothetical protein
LDQPEFLINLNRVNCSFIFFKTWTDPDLSQLDLTLIYLTDLSFTDKIII